MEDMNVQFIIRFTSNDVDIFEEILVVDESSLLNRIIRWFFGTFYRFLIIGFITTSLDLIVDKIFGISST